jgi:hypothetical protein
MIRIKQDVTKRVTKHSLVTKSLRESVTKVGRPRKHASDAERQRAYRERKANG